MGVVEGNRPATDNDWESVKKGGDAKIKGWIDEQMVGTSCAVVLIGANTANRKWINYEIKKAWDDGKGVLGVYIHNLKDKDGNQCVMGNNPFSYVSLGNGYGKLDSVIKAYSSPYLTSTYVYDDIKEKLPDLLEEAIDIRSRY